MAATTLACLYGVDLWQSLDYDSVVSHLHSVGVDLER
jgi:hypothetical protein